MARAKTLAQAAELLGAAPGGSPCAAPPRFEEVYEAHFAFVWRSARRLGVAEASLDDVVQDVFVVAYRRLDSFEQRSELRTWLFGILRRVVADYRRSARRKPTAPLSHEPRAHPDDSPLRAAEREQARARLEALLSSLDADQREVFVLAELEQLSAPEIASALQLNVNTVYSRLRAARARFEQSLQRHQARQHGRKP